GSGGWVGEAEKKRQDKKWKDGRNGERAYGLGTYLNRTPRGRIYSHGGSVALPERGGAYTMKFDSGWTTVVTFDGDPRGLTPDLHRRLEAAGYRRGRGFRSARFGGKGGRRRRPRGRQTAGRRSDNLTTTASEAPRMSAYKSDFLATLANRGFIHQVSEPEALDALAAS